jgi:hypothetical protein
MRKFWIFKGLKMLAFAAVVIAALGYLVMGLWNAVLPAAAGLHPISYLQALGLLVLARILFGGLRTRGHWHWRARMQERWQQMSPEEQEKVRAACGSRHRFFHQPGSDSSTEVS